MVKELALKIQTFLHDIKVSINENAQPDKRSYRVDFGLYEKLAPNHQPVYNLENSITDLINGLKRIDFQISNFRNSEFMRLNIINQLSKEGIIDEQLRLVK